MPAFTIAEAARHCGVDRRTLQRAIRSGRLALTPEHRLTPEALAQAGYLPGAAPEGAAAEAPHFSAAAAPQELPQELTQATALLALLESLTTALGDLHAEVRALRADLRQTPQGRRRGAAPVPQETPQPPPATAAPLQPPAKPPRDQAPVGVRKLTPRQGAALRRKRQRGVPIKALMEEYGISKATLFRYLQ